MIVWADEGVHELKREVEGRFIYHERLLLYIAVRLSLMLGLKVLILLSRRFERCLGTSAWTLLGVAFSYPVPVVVGDVKGDWDFGD